MIKIAASILAADFLKLGEEIKAVERASADLIHIDVMDGHFVPNLSLGPMVIKAIKKITSLPLDVHLMIDAPDRFIDDYIDAGADILTLHVESSVHLERSLKHIKSRQVKAGVALNPATHENTLEYVLELLDLVLVMSVNPGFGGQEFLESSLKKIRAISAMLAQSSNKDCQISVDGGVNASNAPLCVKAGARCLVAGSFIFGANDYQSAIKTLRSP